MTGPAPLARLLGPDALELLDAHIDARVQTALAAREAERRWLTVAEAAVYLGVSEKAVRRRIERGEIPYTRQGRRIVVDRHGLDRQLAERVRS